LSPAGVIPIVGDTRFDLVVARAGRHHPNG
jgi:hypothetical protein